MSRKTKLILTITITVLATLLLLWLLQMLLMPKYMTEIREGALISEYYGEIKKHDIIFVGDCEVYENISPITLWERYGITSYIRGSAQQLIWQSYYILEDTYRYETPKIVIYNVQSMIYGEPQNEAYNRMTLDGLAFSSVKIDAIRASMTEEETLASYLFPLLRYHSRWSDLSAEDFRYWFHRDTVSHNGYLMQTAIRPMESLPAVKPLDDYTLPAVSFEYLDKMAELCRSKGTELILVKSPSLYPHWYDEWDAQITEYAQKNGLRYYNFLEASDEIGIDMQTDTYDMGMHLNVFGAEKYTDYLGGILQEEFGSRGLFDHTGDEALADIWEEKRERYEQEKRAGTDTGQTEPPGPADNTPDPGGEYEEHPHDGYYFEAGGVEISVLCDARLLDRMKEAGLDYKYYEAQSCAYQGLDQFYTFDSFEVLVNTIDGRNVITSISILDDMVEIPEGLRIGDSYDTMVSALGDGYTQSSDLYRYVRDGTMLTVLIKNNSVSSIEYTISET